MTALLIALLGQRSPSSVRLRLRFCLTLLLVWSISRSEKQKCKSIPVAAWSKAWVCGRSPAGIAGSNPAGGMDVSLSLSLLWMLCVVRYRSLWWDDHSSGGDLPIFVCLSMISKPQQWVGLGPLWLSSHEKRIQTQAIKCLYLAKCCGLLRDFME